MKKKLKFIIMLVSIVLFAMSASIFIACASQKHIHDWGEWQYSEWNVTDDAWDNAWQETKGAACCAAPGQRKRARARTASRACKICNATYQGLTKPDEPLEETEIETIYIDCNNAWVISIKPTEAENGKMYYKCMVCEAVKRTAEIQAFSTAFSFYRINNDTAYSVFQGTANLEGKAIIIPSTYNGLPVTHIRNRAFEFSGIVAVIIPDSVTTIQREAFRDNSLTSIKIPYSVTHIEGWAFYYNKLTSVAIPGSVLYIGNGAFRSNSIASKKISNSVYHIGDFAFANNRLSAVSIPASVSHIGNFAFLLNQVNSVAVSCLNPYFTSENGVLFNKDKTALLMAISMLSEFTIPDTVTHIAGFAFSTNQLTSIKIPSSVTHIAIGAFEFNRLKAVKIPSSVIYIGNFAFQSNLLETVTVEGFASQIDADTAFGGTLWRGGVDAAIIEYRGN